MAHYDKNLVTHFSAFTDGTTPSDAALEGWIDFLQGLSPGDSAALVCPHAGIGGAGTYVFNGAGVHRCSWSSGILGGISVAIDTRGVAITGSSFSLGYWRITFDDNLHSSRIDTVNAGSSTVQLKTPSEHARYSVLQWVIVGGVDPQAAGAPANMLKVEKRQITAIDTGTGLITFSQPVSRTYKDTWPLWNGGAVGGADATDCGGPATIIALDPAYDVQTTWNVAGASFEIPNSQMYFKCRSAVFNGDPVDKCRFLSHGLAPTIADNTELNNCINGESEIEFDKMFGTVTSTNSEWTRVRVQTAVGEVYLNGDSVINDVQLARKTFLTDCAIGRLYTGPVAFGYCEELHLINTAVGSAGLLRALLVDAIADWTWMGGGVFRMTDAGPRRLAVPGVWMTFGGNRNYGVPFKVIDAWKDGGGFLYVQTTLSAYPTFDLGASGLGGPTEFTSIPCLKVYASGVVTDDLDIYALNNAPQGRPFYEYNERTISGSQSGSATLQLVSEGELVKIVVDVTTPYTGAQSTCTLNLCDGGLQMTDGTYTYIRPSAGTINLKELGTRTITPSGVTGAQLDDDIFALSGWVMSSLLPVVTTNTTGDSVGQQAVARVQIFTNQGVVDPATSARVRLRLR